VSLRDSIDTFSAPGRMLRTVLFAVAEFERELIIERTSSNIGARARSGKPWGEPVYGYRRGAGGHWTIDHSDSAIPRSAHRCVSS
jgi:DNA invertase Pin-like site-specific DNA recombinase